MHSFVRSIMSRFTIKASAMLIAACGAMLLALLASGSGRDGAAFAAPFAALNNAARDSSRAVDDPELQVLAGANPRLVLSTARLVLEAPNSKVWITTATNGDVCLIESGRDELGPMARFSCKTPKDAEAEGIIGGVPGHFYGAVPDGIEKVTAKQRGGGGAQTISVTSNAYYLPPDTAAVIIGDKGTMSLPAPLPSRP